MNALSFIIEAKDKATATLGKLKKTFSEMKDDWQKAMSGMKEGSYSGILSFGMKIVPMIGAASLAFKAFGASLRWVSEGIQEAAKFEKFTDQLTRVTGSVKLARAELKALTEGGFAVDDLFDEADIVAAAISLKRLSNGILGTAGDMHTIAEAATVTGQSMSEVAQSVGMVTSKLLAGDDSWGRFAMQMVKSGTLSMQTVVAMQKMQAEGRSAGDIISYMWAALNGANAGAIDDARKGIEGLSKAVDDARSDAKRAWGEFFAPIQKGIDHAKISWFQFVAELSKKPSVSMGAMGPWGQAIGHFLEGQMAKNQTPAVEEKKTGAAAIKAKAKEAAAKMGMSPDDFEKQWKEKEDADKKAAEDAVKNHEEVLKKKEAAQAKYDEARRTRSEQLAALEKNKTDIERTIGWGRDEGSDARLEAEAQILDIDTEILKIKKEIADEEAKAASEAAAAAREKANAEDSARKDRKVAESQYKYHAAYDKASPEQQMAITEANIKRWQKKIAEAGDEEAKGKATEGLIGQLKERDRISKEMADKEVERKEKLTGLADRDRELRETSMTADERIAASKQRAADLEKSLAAETDPDKKIKIQEQLMSEAEKQQALAAQKPGPRSMDIGDVFEKGYGQSGKKDMAAKQVEISQDIKRLLEKIEAKEGGMTP